MTSRETISLCRAILLVFFLVTQGCSSQGGKPASFSDGNSPPDMKPSMAVFCRIGENEWRRVVGQDESGVLIGRAALAFSEVWNVDLDASAPADGAPETRKWSELSLPLPEENIPCKGYALTYPGHRAEVSLDDMFSFVKIAVPQRASEDIAFREHLDYEAEIGILLRRGRNDRFGYVMVNDLTDRGVQVRTFDPENMAPGFSRAKSFDGALRVGPLIAVGNEASWRTLRIDLCLNGEVRQKLRAGECLLKPGDLADRLFDDSAGSPWMLVATGTTDGVLFQVPDLWDKIEFFIGAGFSMDRAAEDWLDHLRFLRPGDELLLSSPTLGRAVSRIVKGDGP